jgi:hypothetical protein
MPPADIKFEEFCKTAIESARKGFYLQSSQVDQAVADFLRQYDWVVALWPEARNPSGMGVSIIRDSGKKTGFSRCNSIRAPTAKRRSNYMPCAAAPTITHLTRPHRYNGKSASQLFLRGATVRPATDRPGHAPLI